MFTCRSHVVCCLRLFPTEIKYRKHIKYNEYFKKFAYQHPALRMKEFQKEKRLPLFAFTFAYFLYGKLTDVSNGSRKAVGEMMPVRLFTTIAMPVSMNGSLKSTTASRSALIISEVNTISVLRFTKSAIKPFHLPFSRVPHFPSSTRSNSYVKPIQVNKTKITDFFLAHPFKSIAFFLQFSPSGSANFSSKSMQKPLQH